jgi:hypothetical protein
VEGSSTAPAEPELIGSRFSRGRLVLGILIVIVLAGAAAVAVSRLGGGGAGELVYVSAEGIVLRDLGSGDERVVAPAPPRATTPVADPAAGRIAFAEGGGVRVVDLASGEEVPWEATGRPVAWAPDGRLVVERDTARGRTDLVAVTADGTATSIIPAGLGGPDGPPVWVSEDVLAVRLLDRDGQAGAINVVRLTQDGVSVSHLEHDARPLAASPDGAELLYVAEEQDVQHLRILRMDGFASRPLETSGRFAVAATAPGGLVAVSGHTAEGEQGVWVLEPGTSPLRRVADRSALALAWSADGGTLLYTAGAAVYAVELPDGRPRALDIRIADPLLLAVLG